MSHRQSIRAHIVVVRAFAFVTMLVAASCGVSSETKDRPLAPNEIAYTPQPEPTTTTVTTTTTPPVTTVNPPQTSTTVTTTTIPIAFPLDVYWIDGLTIRPVRRTDLEGTLESAIEALRTGPLFSDVENGLRSAIPSSDVISSATVRSGTATITLSPSFLTLPGNEQTLAIAQIVYTVTNLPGTGLVEFRLDDRPLSVPTAAGQPSRGALSRDDFVGLLAVDPLSIGTPLAPTSTTTTEPRRGGAF